MILSRTLPWHAAGGDQIQLEVTDGWYGVRATIGGPLCHYVASGVLRTGLSAPAIVCVNLVLVAWLKQDVYWRVQTSCRTCEHEAQG